DLGHVLAGQAQREVGHAVGVVPAAHAPLGLETAPSRFAVLVGLGPGRSGLLPQRVQRVLGRRVEQLLLVLWGGGRAVGHLVGLVRREAPAPDGFVGAGLLVEALASAQLAPGLAGGGAGL